MKTTILILLIGATVIGALWWAHPRQPPARAPLFATVALGLAAYFLMGWPGIEGTSARVATPAQFGAPIDDTRARFTQRGNPSTGLLNFADGLIRTDRSADAARMLERAIDRRPNDPDLWLGYANALAAVSDGKLSPAARAAFDRAQMLAPDSPAPVLFRALALAETEPAEARALVEPLLAAAPRDAWWRPRAERVLATLPREPTPPPPDSE